MNTLLFDRLKDAGIFYKDFDIPVIDGTKIAKRIDALPDEIEREPTESYGKLTPIYPEFFIESSTTALDTGSFLQRGVLFQDVTRSVMESGVQTTPPGESVPEGTEWIVLGTVFGYSPAISNEAYALDTGVFFHIDEDGNWLTGDFLHLPVFSIYPLNPQYARVISNRTAECFPFALITLSLMHKRTDVIEVEPNKHHKKKGMRKKGYEPATKQVVYVKEESSPKSYSEYFLPDRSRSNPISAHRVRGHYRKVENHPFIPDGQYWIKSHTRGKGDDPTGGKYKIT